MRATAYEFRNNVSGTVTLPPSQRLTTLLGCKLAIALGLNLFALLPYYLLQHYPIFSVTVMPVTAIDRWIRFDDRTLAVYLSLFFLMPIAPMQMVRRDQLRRYTFGVAAMSLLADLVFLLWPTAVLRPYAHSANIVYQQLTMRVAPLNAFPSLHAAMAVFSALCYEQLASHIRRPGLWRIAIWIWASAIIYATLATKEHVFIDAVGGSLLGLIAYVSAFRVNSILAEIFSKGR